MNRINPNEAPEGYIAVKEVDEINVCSGCSFEADFSTKCTRFSTLCTANFRKDKSRVIFIKKTEVINTNEIDFKNQLLSIAKECGFDEVISKGLYTTYTEGSLSSYELLLKEVDKFASKVFEAGVKFGKEQANKELN